MSIELPEPYRAATVIGPILGWEIAAGFCGTPGLENTRWQLFLRFEGGDWLKGTAQGSTAVEKALKDFREAYRDDTGLNVAEWIAPPPPVNWGRFG